VSWFSFSKRESLSFVFGIEDERHHAAIALAVLIGEGS
jgi:hypothetical protein